MRPLLLTVTAITWLATVAIGGIVGYENLFSETVDQVSASIERMGDSPKAVQLADRLTGFRVSGVGALLMAFLTTIGLVLTLTKKPKPQKVAVGIGVLMALVFIIFSPSIPIPGPPSMSGARSSGGPRLQMMVIGAVSVLSLLAGLGAESKRQGAR